MKLDLFNKRALKEKDERILALSSRLSSSESKNLFYENKLSMLETQMEELCRNNLPTVSGYKDYKHGTARVSFEFNFDFYRRTPEILRYIGERIIAEALRKCDSWENISI